MQNLALIDNPMVATVYEFKQEKDPVPTVDVQQMVKRLYDMSNDMEEMISELRVASEICDCDSYLYCAHEDLNKIHSRLLGFMDELKGEAV